MGDKPLIYLAFRHRKTDELIGLIRFQAVKASRLSDIQKKLESEHGAGKVRTMVADEWLWNHAEAFELCELYEE